MRVCTICGNPKRQDIESALLAKMPMRQIAKTFKTSTASIGRHRPHIHEKMVQAFRVKEVELGNALLDDLKELVEKARSLLQKAEETSDIRTALVGVREIGRLLELRGRATGELTPESGQPKHQPMFILPANAFVSVTVNQVQRSEIRDVTPIQALPAETTEHEP